MTTEETIQAARKALDEIEANGWPLTDVEFRSFRISAADFKSLNADTRAELCSSGSNIWCKLILSDPDPSADRIDYYVYL